MCKGQRLDSLLWRKSESIRNFLRDNSFQVMPGIVMAGTLPVFYKVPITQTLSIHIRHGTYAEETHVTYCYPPVPRPASWRKATGVIS
jgi:hypothetical protein